MIICLLDIICVTLLHSLVYTGLRETGLRKAPGQKVSLTIKREHRVFSVALRAFHELLRSSRQLSPVSAPLTLRRGRAGPGAVALGPVASWAARAVYTLGLSPSGLLPLLLAWRSRGEDRRLHQPLARVEVLAPLLSQGEPRRTRSAHRHSGASPSGL